MEIKYTQEGKKVVVVGELNQNDKIVQEIFLTEIGDEIAQGDRFVERNLLDSPIKSWKETKLEQLESEFEKEKREWESKIKTLINDKKLVYQSLSARVKWLRNVAKEPDRDMQFIKAINIIASFLDGTDKWVFVEDYNRWHFERFSEDGVNKLFEKYERGYRDNVDFDRMRLLSLFGNSDGNITYKISEYAGSNSSKEVEFFKSEEEGLIFLQQKINIIEEYSSDTIKNAEKFNLKLDQDKLKKYKDGIRNGVLNDIAKLEVKITELKECL